MNFLIKYVFCVWMSHRKKKDQILGKEISEPTPCDQYIAVADYTAGSSGSASRSHEVSLIAGETVDVLEKSEKGIVWPSSLAVCQVFCTHFGSPL